MNKRLKELLIISLVFGFLITSAASFLDGLNVNSADPGSEKVKGFPFRYYRNPCPTCLCACGEFYWGWYFLDLLIWSSLVGIGWYLLQEIQTSFSRGS